MASPESAVYHRENVQYAFKSVSALDDFEVVCAINGVLAQRPAVEKLRSLMPQLYKLIDERMLYAEWRETWTDQKLYPLVEKLSLGFLLDRTRIIVDDGVARFIFREKLYRPVEETAPSTSSDSPEPAKPAKKVEDDSSSPDAVFPELAAMAGKAAKGPRRKHGGSSKPQK